MSQKYVDFDGQNSIFLSRSTKNLVILTQQNIMHHYIHINLNKVTPSKERDETDGYKSHNRFIFAKRHEPKGHAEK